MRATFQRFVPTFEVLLQLLDSNYMGRGAKNHFGPSDNMCDASCLSSELVIANLVETQTKQLPLDSSWHVQEQLMDLDPDEGDGCV